MNEQKRPDVKSVVEGKTNVSTHLSFSSLMRDFIQEDIHTVIKSMFTDVVYPKTKQMIYEALIGAISTSFWGVSGVKKSNNTGIGTQVNYARISTQKTNTGASLISARSSGTHPSDVEFESAADATRVLDSMLDVIDGYGQVDALTFYELSNMNCENHALRNYGWDNLSDCKPRRNGNGSWSIPFPKMKQL